MDCSFTKSLSFLQNKNFQDLQSILLQLSLDDYVSLISRVLILLKVLSLKRERRFMLQKIYSFLYSAEKDKIETKSNSNNFPSFI